MSKQLIYLVEDQTELIGFSGLRSQIVFGNETLRERLLRQLSNLQKKTDFELVIVKQNPQESIDLQIFDASLVFFDYIAYSDRLIDHLIEFGYVYNSRSRNTIRAHFNHTISSESDQFKTISFPYDREIGEHFVNHKIFSVPLALPVGIYPDKKYEVALMEYFYQPLSSARDILKIQSCLAREATAKTVHTLQSFLPQSIVQKIVDSPWAAQFSNRVGKNCKIHPTAVIESSVIGHNVEIGPHCYLRGVVVGDNVIIRENCSIKVAVIGRGSYIVPTDIFNCYVGENCNIVTQILYHCVIGAKTFIGGGVGFADLKHNAEPIFSDDQIFFGSVVGENSFIGAGLLFQAGIEIPNNTKLINYNQISFSQFKPGQIYVAKGAQVTHIPKNFLTDTKKRTTREINSIF